MEETAGEKEIGNLEKAVNGLCSFFSIKTGSPLDCNVRVF